MYSMKALSLTALFSAIVLFSVSCSEKDNASPAPAVVPNVFTYDSAKYTIDKGYFVIQHDNAKDVDYGVIRLSSRSLAELGAGTNEITHMLDINYTSTTIVPGTYTFKDTATTGYNNNSNFFGSTVILNLFTDKTLGLNAISPSTVTITKEGANYRIVYDLTVRDNKKVTGTFVGAITIE